MAQKEAVAEQPAPAKRTTRRSVSAQSNQDVSKISVDSSKELGNINEENVSLTEIIADAQKTRYDLRKRAATPLERAGSVSKVTSSTPVGSAPSSPVRTRLCQSITNRFGGFNFCSFVNKCFESGYLRFTIKQLFQILIASILLVVTLSIINHFNLFDLNLLKEKLRINQISNLFKCSYLTNLSSRSWNYVQNIPSSISALFRK